MIDSPVVATIDYDRAGKHFGQLRVPRSTNESGWSNLCIHVISIQNGEGPTVLVMGGNHGDEPEGQIAALKLAQQTRPEDVRGRLIIIPCLSPEASRANTRLWPSGANFNRSFPGAPTGTTDQVLADYVTRHLLTIADVVCDVHSGGRSMMMGPWAEMHMVDDPEQRRKMVDAMLAWNTDYYSVYINIAGTGLLVDQAEQMGKITIGTELGGGGHVTAAMHRIAEHGLRNMLRHVGVLAGEVQTRRSLGKPDGIILKALEREDYPLAPESGLFETAVDIGDRVEMGQLIGRIHFVERPDRDPVEIRTSTPGIVCTVRAIATTLQGDCVAVIGHECTRDELLRGDV